MKELNKDEIDLRLKCLEGAVAVYPSVCTVNHMEARPIPEVVSLAEQFLSFVKSEKR